jgi:nucleotide-binding universal stress UspA family protein
MNRQMTDPIVCGIDISESTRSVVDTAWWLANGIGGRLVVVHVVEEPDLEAQEFASTVRNRLGAGDNEVRVAEGSPAAALLKAVEDEHAEFLVVGSRGQSSLRSGLFGSVSSQVAARARAPVVVVSPQVREGPRGDGGGRSIVCGVDGSEHALAAARVAGQLARHLECRLLLVHALQDLPATASYLGARATNPPLSAQPDARERLAAEIVRDAVDLLGGDATGVVEVGSPWDVLESVADREAGSLLVVAARGRGAVRAALFGSVAARLATTASRPVVMVPELAEAL